MPAPVVEIRGDGVAAYCCTHLLRKAGLTVRLVRPDRPRVPALLLSEAALQLLRDIFDSPSLLADSFPIRQRIVAWTAGQGVSRMEHRGYVTSEQELLANLLPDAPAAPVESDWIVYSSHPLPAGVDHQRLGSRTAVAWRVRLDDRCPPAACMMESLAAGWLFLLPDGHGTAWLLAVGAAAADPLPGSQLIAPHIASLEAPSKPFPAYPSIASKLAGPDWLACGSAAMSFDPICGDGTALAVRAAILAAAVIRAHSDGHDPASLRQHYEARVRAGFQRHIDLCRQFYRHGFGGPWWDTELAALDGFQPTPPPPFRYRLRDLTLEPVSC